MNNNNLGITDAYYKINILPITQGEHLNLTNGYFIIIGEQTSEFTKELKEIVTVNSSELILKQKSEMILAFVPLFIILIGIIFVCLNIYIKSQNKKNTILSLEGYSRIQQFYSSFKHIIIFSIILFLTFDVVALIVNKYLFINFLVATSLMLILIILLLVLTFFISSKRQLTNDTTYKKIELFSTRIFKFATIATILVLGVTIINSNHKLKEEYENVKIYEEFNNYYYFDLVDDGFFNDSDGYDKQAQKYMELYKQTINEFKVIYSIPLGSNTEDLEGSNTPLITTKYILDILDIKDENGTLIQPVDIVEGKINIITSQQYYAENKSKLDSSLEYNIIYSDDITGYYWDGNSNLFEFQPNYIIFGNSYLYENMEALFNNVVYIMQDAIFYSEASDPYEMLYPILEEIGLQNQIQSLKSFDQMGNNLIATLKVSMRQNIVFLIFAFLVLLFFIICNTYFYFYTNKQKIIVLANEGYNFYEINKKNIKYDVLIYTLAIWYSYAHTHLFFVSIILVLLLLIALDYIASKTIFNYLTKKKRIDIIKGEQ